MGDGEAVCNLGAAPLYALVDGNRAPRLSCPVQTIIAGDARSLSIAAASIIAKVTRDRIMVALDEKFPGYGFARHKGYGTAFHRRRCLSLAPASITAKALRPLPHCWRVNHTSLNSIYADSAKIHDGFSASRLLRWV